MKNFNEKELLVLKNKTACTEYGIELMKKYPDKFDWKKIYQDIGSLNEKDVEEIIEYLIPYIDSESKLLQMKLSENSFEKIVKAYPSIIHTLVLNHDLSQEFIERNFTIDRNERDLIYERLSSLLSNQKLSIKFIYKLIEDFDDYFNENEQILWNFVSLQELDREFIECFADYLNWERLSFSQKLSEKDIEDFKDYVDWYNISKYQELSEFFIERYRKKIDWYAISERQKLSNIFIDKYAKKLDWSAICLYQNLSEDIFLKHSEKISNYLIDNQTIDFSKWKSSEYKLWKIAVRENLEGDGFVADLRVNQYKFFLRW